ncbi:hypothetical protein [Alkalihalobacillus trypoxylicola]|uniref:Glycine zipper-like domain-containing protein n=1 Tax=Alkalihalobacillus trypoxylicola TaxID=519424 RepID=A0A162CR91_9BACI|nr:hypothetical protein [Alkalihalobacillus trypoxylicola]KYG26104.1 hypothetical protein AZF04_13550 [Alkalihalobacillus trypoxylicola]
MESERVENLQNIVEEMRSKVDKKTAVKFDIESFKKIVQRLSSFAPECEECRRHFVDLEEHILQMKEKGSQLSEQDSKDYRLKINHLTSHLTKKHKLITKGYYMSIYMSIGMSLGLLFGISVMDNIALGLPIGMSIGLAIGISLDTDAEKKGMVL